MTDHLSHFSEISEHLYRKLSALGITEPTEIQAQSFYPAVQGRDILAQSRTGSGKTLGFLLPMLTQLLDADRPSASKQPVALILSPHASLLSRFLRCCVH